MADADTRVRKSQGGALDDFASGLERGIEDAWWNPWNKDTAVGGALGRLSGASDAAAGRLPPQAPAPVRPVPPPITQPPHMPLPQSSVPVWRPPGSGNIAAQFGTSPIGPGSGYAAGGTMTPLSPDRSQSWSGPPAGRGDDTGAGGRLEEAEKMEEESLEMQGQVIDEKARQKEKVFEDRMAASKGLMAEVDEMEKSYNLKGMRESLKAAHANYTQKLKEQEDGGGFWGTGAEGIGRRALAAIAMALGGAGEALGNKSGARVVMNVINQARDRFMQDQERRTARAAQGIDIAGGMLGAMQESMGSELAAKKTMSAFLRQEFNDKLEWMESKFEAPLARAALMSARAGNKRLAAKDMRDAALAYSSIRSKEAAITSNRAKMALAARGKPLTPDFVKKMSEQAMTVQRGLDIAGRVKDLIAKGQGLGVWESSKWAGLMGSKQANIMAEIRAFARQIGRQMGTDKGNFAEREGEIMVKAMTGQNWDKAGASLRNIIILSDQLSKSYMSTAKGLGEDYNTGSLSHQVAAMQKSWSKLKGR